MTEHDLTLMQGQVAGDAVRVDEEWTRRCVTLAEQAETEPS
jgi:hypothetical protein